MALRELRRRDERGQAGYIPVLVLVLVVTVVAVVLLTRTLLEARSINAKASNIAQTGRGINASTDAIIQLNTTNELGDSIEGTAQPLVGQLNTVIGLAKSIDAKATTIKDSALTINSTAKTIGNSGSSINASAKGIEGQLAVIDPQIASIRAGVATINRNVDTTIGIAGAVRTDVANILNQTVRGPDGLLTNAACIDNKTSKSVSILGIISLAPGVNDPDCRP
ncbi:MAG: hypothetical protein WKF86_09270 [Acidimicrobiales bacterium]